MESLRVGIRVPDVEQARTFYCGLGFEEVGTIPGPDGPPVLAILHWRGAHLILEALDGMPFQDSTRERQIQEGPRGLGVAIGMSVDDLVSVYEYCQTHGCEITLSLTTSPTGIVFSSVSIPTVICGSSPCRSQNRIPNGRSPRHRMSGSGTSDRVGACESRPRMSPVVE